MKALFSSFLFALICQFGFSQTIKDGVTLLENDNVPAARKVFKKLVDANPKNAEAWFYLGEIYYLDEKPDSAAWAYNQSKVADENSYFAHIGLGKIQLDQNRKLEAEKSFARVFRGLKDNQKSPAYILIGKAYMDSRRPNYDKAIENFTEARDLDTKNPRNFIVLGDAYMAKGMIGEALTQYEFAQAKDSKNPEIAMKIARTYFRTNIPDVAAQGLEKLIQQDPNYAPAYKDLYEIYFYKQQYSKVTPLLEKYVSLVGNDVEQRARLVKFLTFQAKDYEKAIAEAKIVLQAQPENYQMHRWLAWASYERDSFQNSFDASKKLFEMVGERPTYPSDYEYYAKAASKLQQADLAIQNYMKVLELDSTRTDIYDFVAKAYYDAKRYPEAETAFLQKEMRGKLGSTDLYYLGLSQYLQKKYSAADSTLTRLTDLQPTYATGWLYRAKATAAMDTVETAFLAKPIWEKYVEVASVDPEKNKKNLLDAYSYLANAAYQKDDIAGAIGFLEKAEILDPANEDIKKNLTELRTFKK